MRKIIFSLFTFFCTLYSFAQFPENFEASATTLPTGWNYYQSGAGLFQFWKIRSVPNFVCEGNNTATMDRDQIGIGNTSIDYLSSPRFTVPVNGQIRFLTKQFVSDNQGVIFKLLLSTNANQSNLAAYSVVLKTWTEEEMNAVYNVCEEKKVDIPTTYFGQQVYVAWVKEYTQPTAAFGGEIWNVDKISLVQKCQTPVADSVTSSNQNVTTGSLNWLDVPGENWDVVYFPAGSQTFTGVPTIAGITVATPGFNQETPNNYELDLINLIPGTVYQYWVRTNCTADNSSDWIGPKLFTTLPVGTNCNFGIPITTLPYQNTTNSSFFSDFYNFPQGTNCGALPPGTNYTDGNDVFYKYTATQTGLISIRLTPTGINTSLFVYAECPTAGGAACLAGVANTGSTIRFIDSFPVVLDEDYYILVSSSAATQTSAHTLLLQYENCDPPVGTIPAATDLGLTQAVLNWSNPTGSTSWEITVQPLGGVIPSIPGTTVTGGLPTYTATDLTSGTRYQYWVRSECSPGLFSAWAGPYPFNTPLCLTDKCPHIFRMTDAGNNGWQGAKMLVRQNNIIVGEIGPTYTGGAGPVDVSVELCNGIPFDLFWSVGGSAASQCRVAIINSFGQTLYTKQPGVGSAGFQIYANTVNCNAPVCDIPPINVAVVAGTLTTTSATIKWDAPATTSWDIYIVEAGFPGPDVNLTSGVLYPGVTSTTTPFSFPFTGLLPDTTYNVYVRVVCSPNPSAWSIPGVFTTIPTCFKPTGFAVVNASITTNTASFNWVNGTPTDTKWEILFVPSLTPVLPTAPVPINPTFPGQIIHEVNAPRTNPYALPVGLLNPATIYYYYIRTVCSPTDKSKWTAVKVFNTVTCPTIDKCNYQIQLLNLTDTGIGPNTWNGARLQVRQNGIVVQTLGGANINGALVNIPICPGVQFDLFWSVAGTNFADLSYELINPFTDVIFENDLEDEVPLTVLYNSVGNCTPSGCQKPTAMTFNPLVTTNTTAVLSWTDVATTNQWEIFVTPFGEDPPVNGDPIVGTGIAPVVVGDGFYYLAGTNPFTVTGLLPGKAYQYYIRSLCSVTEISNWTVLNPVKFITRPVNDECLGAITVPISPFWQCDSSTETLGNTLGATLSLPTFTGAGCGTTDDDVWYKFVATNTTHTISVYNNLPDPATATVPLNYMLLSGDCATLVRISCNTNEISVATGLTQGATYYVRVYSAGNIAGNFAAFTLCVGTPPPPATNDECSTAINVPVNTLSECNLLTQGNIIGATASLPALSGTPIDSPCFGTPNDDVWFSFVANSGTMIVSLLNIVGTTPDLNFAVYSGPCNALVRLNCSANNAEQSIVRNLTLNSTYFIRVWSTSATTQVTIFDVCVKPLSSCQNAAPFCGASEENPYIYQNTSGLPDPTQVACLFSIPNPTFYTLQVNQTGDLAFNIQQNTVFDQNGLPTGTNLDVDFVAWGPFASTAVCDQILLAPCVPGCPNNTTNPNFYPSGNIIDCSFSPSFTETLTINNAIAGQYYIILVTNFSNLPGFIRLVQTNFGEPASGETTCCDVDLGIDQSVCELSTTLNAVEGVTNALNVPSTYEWFLNGNLIENASNVTYVATVSGTYTVKGSCGVNDVEDVIVVVLSPPVQAVVPSDYVVCSDVITDGFQIFDMQTKASQILGILDPALYTLTYHLTEAAAIADASGALFGSPFTNTVQFGQTIYIRVESNILETCFSVVPLKLIVIQLPTAPVISDVKECEMNPIQTITPILPIGVDVEWFDAPFAGNIVNNPSRNQLGAITYYAESISPNLDYINLSSSIIIPAGQTAATIEVALLTDALQEQTENFNLACTVTSANTANITATATGSITDNAAASTVTINSPTVQEGSIANFVVTLSNPSVSNTVIDLVTVDGTASSLDYTSTTTTVTIIAGSTSITVPIQTTTDIETEVNETFAINATITSTNTTNSSASGVATITEIGTLPTLFITNAIGVEGTNAVFNLTLSSASTLDTVIDFATIAGSAGSPGCRSAVRTPVVLQIYPVPLAPIVDPLGVFVACAENPAQTLTASVTPIADTTVAWYLEATGGSPIAGLPLLNSIGMIDYYAESIADGTLCKSLTRTKVTLEIKPIPAIPTSLLVTDRQCLQNPIQTILPTATSSTAGSQIVWWTAAVGGTSVIAPALNTINSIDYYAESQLNGCSSPTRLKVTLEIYPEVPKPTVDLNGIFSSCASSPNIQTLTASAIVPTGTTIVWYTASTAGTPLASAPSINTVGSSMFYAETVNTTTNCKSFERLPVELNIKIVPDFVIQGGCLAGKYIIETQPSTGATYDPSTATYLWTNSSGVTVGNTQSITVMLSGIYTCKITNTVGCSFTEPFDANSVSCTIQRGISPKGINGGDGKNDFFSLEGLNVTKLQIFNRLGTVVYAKNDYEKEWYGQSNSDQELPDGTYFYVIDLADEKSKTGWIYINREQ